MNCEQQKQFILEHLGEEIPVDVQAHLDRCDSCRESYERQLMIKDMFSLRRYEQPKSGRVESGVANIMRKVRLSEDRYDQRQDRLLWMFTEPRYGIALLFLVFIGLNLVRNDRGFESDLLTKDDVFRAEVLMLNQSPQIAMTNDYNYPEFVPDQIPGVNLPSLETPVRLVNFSDGQ